MTTTGRRMRFGISVQTMPDAAAWRDTMRRIEDLGFDTVVVNDHVSGPRLSAIVALTAAAAATSRLRVGTMVLDNDIRHPVVLAKEAAALDLLSDGRLELGMGAGWLLDDYERTGLRYDPPATRIARLAETVSILKGCWSGEPYSCTGVYYQVSDVVLDPLPVQRPHPPLLIGGGGRTVLELAAREADILNVASMTARDGRGPRVDDMGPARFLRKLEILEAASGARREALELSISVQAVGIDRPPVMEHAMLREQVDLMRDTPYVFSGSVEGIAEQILGWKERHRLTYFLFHGVSQLDGLARIVERVRRSDGEG
jgi:probable F420-dependent oxidoreductase